ncbi:twin-arginine translocase TatA/TatE family subunit [Altererythrobacter sp. SALINAS58]|uniref:twin-arginine translocase TatA/TatE family subunit n=1 Tax=Alteripontixanthobacter muriae TaxID=2705546 RepID=UPI001576A41B|nr:twin-arginine translocase TatA/TatE family subunit [Alteripontixanthobacter muriae]NTZ42230.1 twin-arginine translocase TatA/TatE family subunit [Alteripontixanthobacter muriae]
MGSIGPIQLLIIAVVILVLFGRGKISEMMGDFGKGVKSFRAGMSDEDEAHAAEAKRLNAPASHNAPAVTPAPPATGNAQETANVADAAGQDAATRGDAPR